VQYRLEWRGLALKLSTKIQEKQYSASNVRAYEAVFGEDFLSPGGRELALRLFEEGGLQKGGRILDVGSGVGGCAFLLAEEFEAEVVGIDLCLGLVNEANRRCSERGLTDKVRFLDMDSLDIDFNGEFDAIVSRDVFLHIDDKPQLFNLLFQALKPGGRLMFTDYCCGSRPWPLTFRVYMETRRYTLHTISEYRQFLEEANFQSISAQDLTPLFSDTLRRELASMDSAEGLSWTSKLAMPLAWKAKLRHCRLGAHKWGLFQAVKAL